MRRMSRRFLFDNKKEKLMIVKCEREISSTVKFIGEIRSQRVKVGSTLEALNGSL